MPGWLDKEMRRAMGVNDIAGQAIELGFQRCYAALLERAPAFDESAWPQTKKSEELAAEGARDQFAQDAAQIAALKAEIEQLAREEAQLFLTVQGLKAENERLRKDLK